MKKIITAVLALGITLTACNNIAWPTHDPEMSLEGADSSLFSFEALPAGFYNSAISDNLSFTSVSISGDRAYLGNKSLKVAVSFTGAANYRGGLISQAGTVIEMAGKTLTAHVWVPNGMFDTSNPYGATFFIQTADYDWYQSTWQNLTLPSGTIPGIWNTVSFYVDDMTLAGTGTAPGHVGGATVAANGANVNAQYNWGFKIGMGDSSPAYSGTMYIDSITLE
jgi:hypothetical protein